MDDPMPGTPIYPSERRRQIIEAVRDKETVSVRELADRFGVSPSTVRRDLNVLERAGLLARTYGGAEAPLLSARERSLAERRISQADAKQRIGLAAAELVSPGEALFLDGGTTVECMVPHLGAIEGLTVVTFGLNILARLAGLEGVRVIALGGELDHRTLTMGGALAHEFLRTHGIRCDRAFLAASGVSERAGVTNASLDEIPLKRIAMDLARESILLVDGTKLGRDAVAQIAPIDRIDLLVTDSTAPKQEISRLRQIGVRIIMA
jgi:DeoR family transcriptional regulator, fructose operon transcriptional repressor